MNSRIDSWSTSISSILAKTEKNLNLHRHSQPNLYSKHFQSTEEPKILFTESQSNNFYSEDHPNLSLQEFYQFKSYITERLTIQGLELDKIKRKLSLRERPSNDIDCLRDDFNFSLSVVEKRCLGEIKKIMILLNCQEEAYRKSSGFEGVNQPSETNSQGFLKFSEFQQDKESFVREIEKVRCFSKDQVDSIGITLNNVKEGLDKEIRKFNEKFEMNVRDLNFLVEDNRKKIENLVKENKEKIEKIEKNQENWKLEDFLIKTQKNSKKLETLEKNIEKYSKENLQNSKLFKISEDFQSFSEKQAFFEKTLNEELQNLKEALQNSKNFALKSDLHVFKKQVQKKFRKFFNQASPIKPNEKISDSLIAKLVQLEQRVSLLEDFSESESGVVENQKLLNDFSSFSDLSKSRNNETNEVQDFAFQVFKKFLHGEIDGCVQILSK